MLAIDLGDIDLTLTNTSLASQPHIWVEDPHLPSAPSAPSTSPSPHLSASTSTLALLGYLGNKGPPLSTASTTFNDDFNFAMPSPLAKVKNLPQSSSSTPSIRSPYLLISTSQEGLTGCIGGPIQPGGHVLPAAHELEEATPASYNNYSIHVHLDRCVIIDRPSVATPVFIYVQRLQLLERLLALP